MAGRKNKHAYLDDFEKDLNGNYQYRGAHYRYAGTPSRGRALAVLWLCCGGGAALALSIGFTGSALHFTTVTDTHGGRVRILTAATDLATVLRLSLIHI